MCGIDLTDFQYEIGYKYIRPLCRGQKLGYQLSEAALRSIKGEKVYTITATDNIPVLKSMNMFGFLPQGPPYRSSLLVNRPPMQLFVKMEA